MLRLQTGDDDIDALLRGSVGVFETALPGKVRCYQLAGSYAEGTATATSDVDLDVVLRDDSDPACLQSTAQLLTYCGLLSRVELGPTRTWESQYRDYWESGDIWSARGAVARRVYGKPAKPVIYGEDLRDRWMLPSIGEWTRQLMQHALSRQANVRGAPERLVFPLAHPDPDDRFFGYARLRCRARDGALVDTTRGLVRTVLDAANAMVSHQSQRYVVGKQDVAAAYEREIGDEWASLVTAVDQTCRVELAYLVPPSPGAGERLRELCAAALSFENHFLSWCREFVLSSLAQARDDDGWLPPELAGWYTGRAADDVLHLAASGELPSRVDDGSRRIQAGPCVEMWAASVLGTVLFPDDERVLDALRGLCASSVKPAQLAAEESLTLTRGAAG